MAFEESEVTARLADYVVGTRPGDLPQRVRDEALRSFFNIVGCTIGGARHEIVDLADKTLAPFAGPQQATLFARGRKADILHASLINAFASSIYSFDDTHAQAVVHPAGPVAAAVLALAELRPVSGVDLLTAFALGVELECRLCKGVSVPPAKGSMAWSGTGISGGFGAVAAVGKLLKLDTEHMRWAMGIALSQASGFRAMHGSMQASMMPAQGGANRFARGHSRRAGVHRVVGGARREIWVFVRVLRNAGSGCVGRRVGIAVRTAQQYL